MVSIPACHAGDRGSIPRRGGIFDAGQDELHIRAATLESDFFVVFMKDERKTLHSIAITRSSTIIKDHPGYPARKHSDFSTTTSLVFQLGMYILLIVFGRTDISL